MDTMLALALDVSREQRERTLELEVGYDGAPGLWEVIVRYEKDAPMRWQEMGIGVSILSGDYALLRLTAVQLRQIAVQEELLWAEKPRSLFFMRAEGSPDFSRQISCLPQGESINEPELTGRGVLVAAIDSGIDYEHPDFITEAGESRILYLWDQAGTGTPPEGFSFGSEYTREQLTHRLHAQVESRMPGPGRDITGHGTAVMGIAAGNGRASGGRFGGVAPDSELIVVRMRQGPGGAYADTAALMAGASYVMRKSERLGRPVALNISYGNTYGSHEGDTLVETFLDMLARTHRCSIVIGMGNEAAGRGHVAGALRAGETRDIALTIGARERAINIQLWTAYTDEIRTGLLTPSGGEILSAVEESETKALQAGNTVLLMRRGEPGPQSPFRELFMALYPAQSDFLESGTWILRLKAGDVTTGRFDLWLPPVRERQADTGFEKADPAVTLTIPAAAGGVISVGAYAGSTRSYAPFSGRGYTRATSRIKPDLAAPGVDVTAPSVGGGYALWTGTSFATPFVTGAAALLMEWGIVMGNDPYLYGEKVKAYLRRGARPLSGQSIYPNAEVGFGALCIEDSLPHAKSDN